MRPDELAAFAAEVNDRLDRGLGVRVGETALISRRVHVIDPTHPDEAQVKCAADAGQVFYRRSLADEIVHIDIFHSLADVNHYAIAQASRRAAEEFSRETCPSGRFSAAFADFIDVQTATGGGRVTGSLKYGRKPSLQMAHRGHVHLAVLMPREDSGLLYYLVRNAEQVIQWQGVELRRLDRIVNDRNPGGTPVDLSPYSCSTDSLLQEHAPPANPADDCAMMKDALDAAADFGSVSSLAGFLECVAAARRRENPYALLEREYGDAEAMLARLRALEILSGDGACLALTDKGRQMAAFLRRFAREMETQMRKVIRRSGRARAVPLDKSDFTRGRTRGASVRESRAIMSAEEADFRGAISVPGTIGQWAVRCSQQGRRGPIELCDVRIEQARRRVRVDVCLLIDASASMAGKRIQAAKHLARYMFLTCRDRVSVLTFQDRNVTPHVIRARSHRALEHGLSGVRPAGLTPLAAGIVEAVRLLGVRHNAPAMLVLLTDGIPTMNQWTGDPARDALTAAEHIAQNNIPFTCIGLAPNKGFLRRLTEIARGTLYIVDEFDRDVLAKLVKDERSRVQT
ncbi:MAG: vWA domain-containing protein [Bacillota bacterium]